MKSGNAAAAAAPAERTASQREAVLEELMQRYGDSVKRVCYVCLNDMALAEDAAQETFLKAWRALDSFRGDAAAKTWLMRIAINTCRDYQRTPWHRFVDRRVPAEERQDSQTEDETPDDTVLDAVRQLPRKYKEVVLLFYYQSMPLKDIAQALSVPVPTVSSRLVRARAKLKDTLKEWYHEEP